MALSVFSGPMVTVGNQSTVQNQNPDQGPNLDWQGTGMVDPRYVGSIGAAPSPGKVAGLYENVTLTLMDCFPQAPQAAGIASIAGSTAIATAAAGGTAIPLVATNGNLGFNINVPVCPWITTRNTTNPTTDGKVAGYGLSSTPGVVTSTNVVSCLALDLGPVIFTLPATGNAGTTTLTAATSPGAVVPTSQAGVVVNSNACLTVLAQSTTNWKNPLKFYQPGQFVIVPGAGNAGGTTCLIAKIVALDYLQGILVLNTPVVNSSLNSTGVGVSIADPTGTCAWPYFQAGAVAIADPAHLVARTLSVVSSSASDTAMLFTIQGFDCWNQPMTEQITSNGTTPVLGVKAWKYISTITASHAGSFSTTGTVTVGTGATNTGAFGFPLRVDAFEYLEISVNGATVTANTGFTAGLAPTTNPATYTTADIRGTYAMQTAPSGAVRMTIFGDLPMYQTAQSTNLNWLQLFGLTQT